MITYGVNIGATLIVSPIILRGLGAHRYGVWAIAMATIGYYSLLDFGLRAAIVHRLTRAISKDRPRYINRVVSTGMQLTICIAFIVIVATLACSFVLWFAPFGGVALRRELALSLLVLGPCVAVQIALFPGSTILVAANRIDIREWVVVVMRIVSAITMCIAVRISPSLIALSFAFGIPWAIGSLVAFLLGTRIVRRVQISRRHVTRRCRRLIASTGVWNFTDSIADRISYQTDTFTVAACVSAAAVTSYSFAGSMLEYGKGLFGTLNRTLIPIAMRHRTSGDHAAMSNLLLTACRYQLLVAVPMAFISAQCAVPFFNLWLGSSLTLDALAYSPGVLYWVLCPTLVLSALTFAITPILTALEKQALLAKLSVASATINLVLSIGLAFFFRELGVAIGTVIPAFVFCGIVRPLYACKLTNTPVSSLFWSVGMKAAKPALIYIPLTLALGVRLATTSWMALFIFAGFNIGMAAIATGYLGLETHERRQLMQAIGSRLRAFIAPYAVDDTKTS